MKRSLLLAALWCLTFDAASASPKLTLARDGHWLVIQGEHLPGREVRINYLEAYCRAGSTVADWVTHTVIPHTSETLSLSADRSVLRLRDTLEDAVTVEHTITATDDAVDFSLAAKNGGSTRSEAHWAQPCIRLAAFTGFDPNGPDLDDYLGKCFIYLDGRAVRLPTTPWATEARYVPGQVWGAPGVPASDLNPRPHSALRPSHGLIGVFSGDEKMVFATAWEPWQELFQGVARCIHSDFRLGGLQPGETKRIRGKIPKRLSFAT